MKTSQAGLDFIAECEGLRLEAYPDPGSGGEPWTIGYGHTSGVKPGDRCTKDQAMGWLRQDVVTAETAVMRSIDVALSQSQFDALVSFTYNLGGGALAGSTLRRKLNAGDRTGAAEEFLKWVRGPNGVLPGLVKRRARECAMFLNGVV